MSRAGRVAAVAVAALAAWAVVMGVVSPSSAHVTHCSPDKVQYGGCGAAPTVCGGAATLPSGNYSSLLVPAGETCLVEQQTIAVDGNVLVERGATLWVFVAESSQAKLTVGGNALFSAGANFLTSCFHCTNTDPIAIGGNLIAKHAEEISVELAGARIDGSVVLTGVTRAALSRASIGGSVVTTGVSGPSSFVSIADNAIGGDVVIVANHPDTATPGYGYIEVNANTIGKNLVCVGNNPAPTSALANTIGGKALGQCAGL